jgi:hypothetical protein
MTLSNFIRELQKIEAEGHGDLPVMYRHGASGDCGPVGSAHDTDRRDDQGPFDPEEGEYVSVYVGR